MNPEPICGNCAHWRPPHPTMTKGMCKAVDCKPPCDFGCILFKARTVEYVTSGRPVGPEDWQS